MRPSNTCTVERHESIKADPVRWAALPLHSIWTYEVDEDCRTETLEMRNCPDCSSTLAIGLGVMP